MRYLRGQLDQERAARQRADTVIAQLFAAAADQARTIWALEAPNTEEPSESPQTATTEPVEPTPLRADPGHSGADLSPLVEEVIRRMIRTLIIFLVVFAVLSVIRRLSKTWAGVLAAVLLVLPLPLTSPLTGFGVSGFRS